MTITLTLVQFLLERIEVFNFFRTFSHIFSLFKIFTIYYNTIFLVFNSIFIRINNPKKVFPTKTIIELKTKTGFCHFVNYSGDYVIDAIGIPSKELIS